jgi:hypothetical protein
MYLESLLRLAEIIDHYNNDQKHLISEQFHKDTVEIISAQSKFLAADIESKEKDPGPYNFGFGDFVVTIYSPDQTEIQEWAALARKGSWQKSYRFNSILGLIKVLSLATKDSSSV